MRERDRQDSDLLPVVKVKPAAHVLPHNLRLGGDGAAVQAAAPHGQTGSPVADWQGDSDSHSDRRRDSPWWPDILMQADAGNMPCLKW